jgi:hypothetical protein
VSVVVVLIQNIWICEGGREGMLEDFHGWLSLSDINAVTKIRKISWVLDQKYLGSFEIWCWKENGGQLDRSCENEVLHRVKEERKILLTVQRRKANWIGHILRGNWLLKHVIE